MAALFPGLGEGLMDKLTSLQELQQTSFPLSIADNCMLLYKGVYVLEFSLVFSLYVPMITSQSLNIRSVFNYKQAFSKCQK